MFECPPATRGPAHRSQPHHRDARRPPHHEHVPGCLRVLLPERRRRRPGAQRPGHVPGGLPVRPARVEGRLLDGLRVSPRTRGARSRSRCPTCSASSATTSDFLPLVRERVDILFANESEACTLWGCDEVGDGDRAGAGRGRRHLPHPAATSGSVIVAGGETHEFPAHPVEVVDTTGAGDLYAAGFLYGYTAGMPAARVRRLGVAGGVRGDQPHRRPARGPAGGPGLIRRSASTRPRMNWRLVGATLRITRSDWTVPA